VAAALSVNSMKEWVEIARPIDVEADIPLKDQAPTEIKENYDHSYKNKFIAWVNNDGSLIGCIKNNRSIAAESSKAAVIVLYEREPAKGDGYVGLEIKSETGECLARVAGSRYSQKSLLWLKQIQPILAKVFKLRETYEYHGKDA
jgi:hypothetical protein